MTPVKAAALCRRADDEARNAMYGDVGDAIVAIVPPDEGGVLSPVRAAVHRFDDQAPFTDRGKVGRANSESFEVRMSSGGARSEFDIRHSTFAAFVGSPLGHVCRLVVGSRMR